MSKYSMTGTQLALKRMIAGRVTSKNVAGRTKKRWAVTLLRTSLLLTSAISTALAIHFWFSPLANQDTWKLCMLVTGLGLTLQSFWTQKMFDGM